MSRMTKFMSVLALTGGLAAVSAMPVHAFSIIAPAQGDQAQSDAAYVHPPMAFAGVTSGADAQNKFALSQSEIMHVQWCAERYKTAYHAIDNTYTTANGARAACRSPY